MPCTPFASRPFQTLGLVALGCLTTLGASAQTTPMVPPSAAPAAPPSAAPAAPAVPVVPAPAADPSTPSPLPPAQVYVMEPEPAPAPTAPSVPAVPAPAVQGPSANAAPQTDTTVAHESGAAVEPKKETPWYEKIKIRGYTQFRYNRIPGVNRNDDLKNSQGDRFLGRDNGFGIRRARVILYGDVHERVSIYLQPDFASTISGDPLNVTILRDWYADLFFDKAKTLRLRVGQSKVPYGFENMQSSQNRLPFDRNDALNSAVKDERDIGMFLYWAPKHIRERFKYLVDSGLKGSGDYGVLGLGVYNGQTANKPAMSDNMHVVGRVTWPFQFGEQFLEIGGGGYFGKYRVSLGDAEDVTLEHKDIDDARAFASFVLYPQPFGIQAEATYGTGPSLGWNETKRVESRELFGGYAQLMYKIDGVAGTVSLIPFVRATYYEGGKKFETLAPKHEVKEIELGIEWQLVKALEIVAAYDMAQRKVQGAKLSDEKGHVGRVQIQWNY